MTTQRLHWADTAKALAVVLVVVYHVSLTTLKNLAPGMAYDEQPWGILSTWLLPVRMPLFFLISGVLATGAVARPWPRVLRSRVLDHFWTFALWSVAISALYAWAYAPQAFGAFAFQALSWTFTFGGFYWYLPMLMLFFVTARLLRGVPVLLVGGAAVLYFLAPDLPRTVGHPIATDAMLSIIRYCQFLVWFAIGTFARPLVERWARMPALVALGAAVLYVPGAAITYGGGPDLTPILSFLGITAALGCSRGLSRLSAPRRLGRYLAERTLPIYLVHPLVLTLLLIVLPDMAPLGAAATTVIVPAAVVVLVALSCLTYDRTRDGLPWLYATPGAPRTAKAAV